MKILEWAFEDFHLILDKIDDDAKQSFRTRARNIPTYIEEMGLAPVLSFLLAKSDKSNFKNAFSAITNNQKPEFKEGVSGEKKGYALYTALLIHRITKVSSIISEELANKCSRIKNQLTDDKFLDFLETILKFDRELSSILKPYLIELKLLSEAFFEEESKG